MIFDEAVKSTATEVQLKYIEAVELHGDGTKAAAALGVNKSTINRSIKAARMVAMNAGHAPEGEKFCRHLVIPDTQIKPDVPLDHLTWAGEYCAEKRPEKVVILGDWCDFPSLSSYDKGKKSFEGRRYKADVEAAREGMNLFMAPINKARNYRPRKVLLLGNHEHRADRAVEDDAMLEGLISISDLQYESHGWEVIPFLEVINLDGLLYSHYFYNQMSGKAFGGTCHVKLKNIGKSFVMGHQQGLDMAMRELPDGSRQMGLVAGSFYQHEEIYKGPQGNSHWQGIVMLNEVRDGRYDPMPISLEYLRRRYGK